MEARPELFHAVVSDVGFHDAVRGEFAATGPANVEEFGTVATPEGFRTLVAMSAYANASTGRLPVGAPHGRLQRSARAAVGPGQDGGAAAGDRRAPGGSGNPVLMRTEFAGGHGIDATLDQTIDEVTDVLAFLLWQAGVEGFK
jgi:prolyl oligopeptidase